MVSPTSALVSSHAMLPPRPIEREPAGPPRVIERQLEDPRVWELHERVIRIETDRRWLNTALFVVLIGAGILAPGIGIWMSERRADRLQEETTRIEQRVTDLDRDVGELLTAVLTMAEERVQDEADDGRVSAAPPRRTRPQLRGPAAPTGASGARSAAPASAQQWAETFGGRILEGPLDERERASLLAQWQNLSPDVQDQTLTALLRRYGLDPQAFLAALHVPGGGG